MENKFVKRLGTQMQAKLMLSSGTLSQDKLQALTRELSTTLNDETDLSAKIPEGTPAPGEKGDPFSIGTLVLSFVTSGAAVALFEVIRAYFERDSSLVLELERPDGTKMVIRRENVGDDQFDKTVKVAKDLFVLAK